VKLAKQIILCANTPEEQKELALAKQRFPRLHSIYFNKNAMLVSAGNSLRLHARH
jgi:hypothetical protein